MANISSINGNPIVLGASGISNNVVTDAKLAQTGGVLSRVSELSDFLGVRGMSAFTIESGSSHSSLLDAVENLNISSGDTFNLYLSQSAENHLTLYSYATSTPQSGQGTTIVGIDDKENFLRLTAPANVGSLSVYQASSNTDNDVSMVVYKEDEIPYAVALANVPPHAKHLTAGTYDLNNFYEYGYYSFAPNSTLTNAPFDYADNGTNAVYTLDVLEIGSNKAGYQILKRPITGDIWVRYFSGNHGTFYSWKGTVLRNGEDSKVVQIPADFNDLTVAGSYMIATDANHLNSPNVMAMCWLEVTTRNDGVVNQLACYPRIGGLYVRQRNKSNVWSEWFDLAPNNGGLLTVDFTVPTPNRLTFKSSIARNSGNIQDIAVYNGHVFDFSSGVMSVDGGADVVITNGHGNNCNFGTELHGDFPYLYCGSWNMSDCNVYVNQVTATSATLVDTIEFPTLTGHLNSVVDEAGGRIYILLNKSESTAVGDIDFIVANLSDGSIISQSELPFAIPVIQGMDYVDGAIYVAHGGAGGYTENHVMVLDTSGRMLANTADITQFTEIEGIAFDGGKMYLANGATIYH